MTAQKALSSPHTALGKKSDVLRQRVPTAGKSIKHCTAHVTRQAFPNWMRFSKCVYRLIEINAQGLENGYADYNTVSRTEYTEQLKTVCLKIIQNKIIPTIQIKLD